MYAIWRTTGTSLHSVDVKSLGKRSKICVLLAAIFNQRLPELRYIGYGDDFTVN